MPQKKLEKFLDYYTLWCNEYLVNSFEKYYAETLLGLSRPPFMSLATDPLSDVLAAVSHPTRRAIIHQLTQGPARFLDVARSFDLALNAVAKHLKMLERAGLISRQRKGREVFITFRAEPLKQAAAWLNHYEGFWNQQLDQFEEHFKQKKGRKDR